MADGLLASMLMVENREAPANEEVIGRRRVVVTGIGMVTPLGLNGDTTWKNLIDGKSGITPIESKYTPIKVAGQIKDFDPLSSGVIVVPKELGRISRPAQLSLAAAFEALTNAGLLGSDKKLLTGINAENVGVKIGTGIGGAPTIAEISERLKAGKKISPFAALLIEPERVSSVVSIKFGLKGPLATPVAACATGNIAITLGCQDIALGEADIMVVGGTESMFENEIGFALYDAVNALSKDPDARASRPFHRTRNGFVMGEGAGVLVLEEYEHAKRRGAKILAEVVGYKNTADAESDTEPSGEGAERAMIGSLKKAGVIAEKGTIYVNAHATSTPIGDRVELGAIAKTLRSKALDNFAVSSTKGATGHLMGAAGAVEAIFCIKALQDGVIPPTINLDDPLEEGAGINLVPIDAQKRKIDGAVNNGFGFGGINSTIVFAIPKD